MSGELSAIKICWSEGVGGGTPYVWMIHRFPRKFKKSFNFNNEWFKKKKKTKSLVVKNGWSWVKTRRPGSSKEGVSKGPFRKTRMPSILPITFYELNKYIQ